MGICCDLAALGALAHLLATTVWLTSRWLIWARPTTREAVCHQPLCPLHVQIA